MKVTRRKDRVKEEKGRSLCDIPQQWNPGKKKCNIVKNRDLLSVRRWNTCAHKIITIIKVETKMLSNCNVEICDQI